MKGVLRVVVVLACLPTAAWADRIHLQNGNVFDDVVLVSRTEAQVRFLVGPGEMSIPSSWIARIERGPGALEEYLRRSRELAAREQPTAEGYVSLARWARLQGLGHGFRESLLAAAELEPNLEGLAPLMAGIGYDFDSTRSAWLPERSARPQPEHREARAPASDAGGFEGGDGGRQAEPSAPNAEIAAGLTRAIETLAEAELERSRRPSAFRSARTVRHVYPQAVTAFPLVSSGWVFPGVPLRSADSDPNDPIIRKPANPYARALLARPPGSLLPVSAYRH